MSIISRPEAVARSAPKRLIDLLAGPVYQASSSYPAGATKAQ